MKSYRNRTRKYSVVLERLSSNSGNIFTAKITGNGGEVLATGWAKCHPTDKNDDSIGYALAESRALNSLAKRLMKQANGEVRNHDEVRARQSRRAALSTAVKTGAVKAQATTNTNVEPEKVASFPH